ncbi:SLBB domain-containing protein [uncultured Abyssibacter sp.]|uniref:SLBB domain-containing protein n=1 Tax=uncultured Abyssibacter sp. TaxID=2320202 RepID=UPI0032B16DB2
MTILSNTSGETVSPGFLPRGLLTALIIAFATVASAQSDMKEWEPSSQWSDTTTTWEPPGDRRALYPPTTIIIPDTPASVPPVRESVPTRPAAQPSRPAADSWQGVPPPEVDPSARWPTGRAPETGYRAPAGQGWSAPTLTVPPSQVQGGPRVRRSATTSLPTDDTAPIETGPVTRQPVGTPQRRTLSRPKSSSLPDAAETWAADVPATTTVPQPGYESPAYRAPDPYEPPVIAQPSPRLPPAPVFTPSPIADAPMETGLPATPLGSGQRAGLGAGDSIRVTVFGQPDLTTETVVGDDGSVTLPLVNRIQLAGLSPQQAGDRIAMAYERGEFLKDPQVNVTIEALRSRQISVLGAVASPGRFPLESSTSVLDALALAGGITADGSRTVTLVRRAASGQQRYAINLDQLLTAGSASGIDLVAGDTIYVPEAPKFYVYGEVRRPDAYPLTTPITVMQAISLGGGLTDRGSDSKVTIRRTLADGRTITQSAELEDMVQPDDVIVVKERLF